MVLRRKREKVCVYERGKKRKCVTKASPDRAQEGGNSIQQSLLVVFDSCDDVALVVEKRAVRKYVLSDES